MAKFLNFNSQFIIVQGFHQIQQTALSFPIGKITKRLYFQQENLSVIYVKVLILKWQTCTNKNNKDKINVKNYSPSHSLHILIVLISLLGLYRVVVCLKSYISEISMHICNLLFLFNFNRFVLWIQIQTCIGSVRVKSFFVLVCQHIQRKKGT